MWFVTKYEDVDRVIDGVSMKNVPSIWLTNIDHGRRHQPLPLMTMADNLKFSHHKDIRGKESYDRYDNYNAIEVPFTDAIPNDYDGIMGVPISFLDKYCPEQFEIVGRADANISNEIHSCYISGFKDKGGAPLIKGKFVYKRILIRKKQ